MESAAAVIRAAGPLSIAAVLLVGSISSAAGNAVSPFSEIQASPITLTPDASGRSAILEVETTIDAACSVVYGVDESFGQIAVDSDMGGGAHADHHPVLGGLTPGKTYLYRVQGTATDGRIYVSDVMTFSTPTPAPGVATNLALDATVLGASSEWSSAYAAGNAFDGDPSTEWSSQGDGNDAWIEIELADPQRIDGLEFRSRSMSDGTARTTLYVLVADGTTYGPFPADERVSGIDIEAQVLRFDVVESTGGNTGAVDILVFGVADDS